MMYLPEKLYAVIRRLSMLRDQVNEDRIRDLNRLHREMKIYFPEYKNAFGKIDRVFCLGAESSKLAVKWFVHRIIESNELLADIEKRLIQMCMDTPYVENIPAISGIGKIRFWGYLQKWVIYQGLMM